VAEPALDAATDELPEGLSKDDLSLEGEHAPDQPPAPAEHQHGEHGTRVLAPSELPESGELASEPGPSMSDFVGGLRQGIYQDPILCGVLAGAVLGFLGVFIVLRRAVFVTAAVSQAAALGVALAFFLEIRFALAVPPVVGALVLALIAAAVMAAPVERAFLPRESALGFAFVTASAIALLVGDRITVEAHDISSILFGTAVLVRRLDLLLVAITGVAVIGIGIVSYRGLVFSGFDPEGARVQGLPVRALDLLLWALVAVAVSVTTRALGALPVFAFAVIPAMAALALVKRVPQALIFSSLVGALSGGLGYLCAFFLEFPVGASQAAFAVLVLSVCLPVALVLRRR
jgi:zinc transport system permease protein